MKPFPVVRSYLRMARALGSGMVNPVWSQPTTASLSGSQPSTSAMPVRRTLIRSAWRAMPAGDMFPLGNIFGVMAGIGLLVSLSVAQDSSWSPVVEFTTGAPPALSVPSQVDFGNVTVGYKVSRIVPLTNTGAGLVEITNITSTNPVFILDRSPMSILAYGQDSLRISFSPGKRGTATSTITIISNLAPIAFSVSGRGLKSSTLSKSE